jgi:aldehyde:ferredoxin oxidoreductase
LRHDLGTPLFLNALNQSGGLPTRNFAEGSFAGAEKISGERMAETILIDRATCYACPVRCKRVVKTDDQWAVDPIYGGPEYETLGSFGSFCGVDDLPAIAKANELCNANGLDTIGAGVAIAWAMECYERGLITTEDTGGLELRFGNAPAVVQLVEDIVYRRGFGALLALGAYRAAQQIGRGAERYVMAARKQEAPMHDPRVKWGLNIGYTTSPTGADHMHNIHDSAFQTTATIKSLNAVGVHEPLRFDDLSPAKVRMAKRFIHQRIFQNCAGLCNFMAYSLGAQAELVAAGTGWDFSVFELEEAGERALAMARVWNYRCGWRAEDDAPISRFSEPTKGGPNEGDYIPAETMAAALATYYDMMGWDHETGAPQEWKLHELGLGWLVA